MRYLKYFVYWQDDKESVCWLRTSTTKQQLQRRLAENSTMANGKNRWVDGDMNKRSTRTVSSAKRGENHATQTYTHTHTGMHTFTHRETRATFEHISRMLFSYSLALSLSALHSYIHICFDVFYFRSQRLLVIGRCAATFVVRALAQQQRNKSSKTVEVYRDASKNLSSPSSCRLPRISISFSIEQKKR